MGNINVLPTEISNKIAAGEVVERPASVVKELVENAIDAGADTINIEIKKGGITYIRVTDNGSGMSREDASIAFLRHATSKISKAEDLDAIYTLGFRGEALSSIGAVSCAELFTKRREDSVGTRVVCTGGKLEACEDVGTPDGTTFAIHNLFFNTPARMNFLKKDAAEAAAVTDIIERFILSHPEISFRYTVDGKEKYFTAGDNNLTGCIYAIYGKSYAKSIIPIDYEAELLKITGAIGKGDAARPNRGYQSFFVNKRYIKSLRISAAVENAYKNQIMIGKHPMAILNIEINPRHTDINVHPTKLEVKFSREEDVMRAIYYAVRNALYAIPNVPQIEHDTEPTRTAFLRDSISTANQVEITAPVTEKVPEAQPAAEPPKPPAVTSYAFDASNEYFIKKQNEIASAGIQPAVPLTQSAAEDEPKNATIHKLTETLENPEPAAAQASAPAAADAWGFDRDSVRVIGQAFDTYILAEAGDTMIIADQHAAHERLKYEELKRELAAREVTSQMLLVPVTVELTAGEYVSYCENAAHFAEIGFEIEDFGANTLLVRATPEPIDTDELKALIIELIDRFSDTDGEIIAEKTERALYTIACKAAVKANHRYSVKELETLLTAVLDLENINTCPHGRPIIVTMTKKELEKEFKRIV